MQTPMQAFNRRKSEARGMLNDIWETPEVLRKLLKAHLKPNSNGAGPPTSRVHFPELEKLLPTSHGLKGRTPMEVMAACGGGTSCVKNKLRIIGCGTSYHAAVLAEYLIETIARIPVEVQYSSEFRYQRPLIQSGDVVVVVSNSGETVESVDSLRMLQRCEGGKNVLTVGVVNEVDSTIAREADAHICAMAGNEVGVACTKVFSSTVAAFVLLAFALGESCKGLSTEDSTILDRLQELPDLIQKVIERESQVLYSDAKTSLQIGQCQLWDIGCQNVLAANFIYLGRGFNFPIALEGAMKCKEIAYIHAEGYPAAEMKHGPIALIDQFMPVVVICPRSDPTYEKIKANIEEVKARSGSTIAITEDDNDELDAICEYVIRVPSTHEYLIPLVAVIPLQLLSYMMGVLRGNEVDEPRGLQKFVSWTPGAGGRPAAAGKGGYPS